MIIASLARNLKAVLALTSVFAVAFGITSGVSAQGNAPGPRIETARHVSPRDFDNHNYERIFSHRKHEAIRILLEDPEVNALARGWISSFEAYDPLTNNLESVSVQGARDVKMEGGIETEFKVTVLGRQVAYGLVDRITNELVALEITEPRDVSWTQWKSGAEEGGVERLRTVIEQPEVAEYLEGKPWYPLVKVAEEITAFRDYPHGEVSPVALFVKNAGKLSVASAFIDVSDAANPRFLGWKRIEKFVELAPHELARNITPNAETVLGSIPRVPLEQRPWFTANDGFHRIEEPSETFEQHGWRITWTPPVTQGVTLEASFRGKPVFEAMDSPTTYTGYHLPPRQGRDIASWYFPDDSPVFTGHLLYWDIHSIDFGGPGMLGKIDYSARRGHPAGFRLRTHYHTGAYQKSSVDFHSGLRFGPYNYDISYEFFEDGTVLPIWRRQGPGYVTEHLAHDGEGGARDWIVQHYTSAIAIDVTPGTTEGVAVQLFDGNEWKAPEQEFYVEGEPGMIASFRNPAGSERIDIPLDRDKELVVVRRKSDEFGPGEATATRVLDAEAEAAFYHPSQYADRESIQNERVIVWLLMEAATGQMPHPAGLTSFATLGELQLKGY